MAFYTEKFKCVADMPKEYYLCQHSGEFESLMNIVGLPRYSRQYTYGFALAIGGEITELWGFDGSVPYMYKAVECIYNERIGAKQAEITHTFYAIGQLHRTRSFPKNEATFLRRINQWIADNRPNTPTNDIARMTVAAAFNFGWLRTSALDWHGVERDSLWLTR